MEFSTKPEWKLLKNHILLTGCRYYSHTNMYRYSYWLLNGKHKIQSKLSHNKILDNVFKFPDLKITSFNMIGNYECVIESKNIQRLKIISSKALFSNLKGELGTFSFEKHF